MIFIIITQVTVERLGEDHRPNLIIITIIVILNHMILIIITKVTVKHLGEDHCPNHLIPSLQLPSLVSHPTHH